MGLIPVDTNIDYGGNDYIAPSVTEEMIIVDNGVSEFYIVISGMQVKSPRTISKSGWTE